MKRYEIESAAVNATNKINQSLTFQAVRAQDETEVAPSGAALASILRSLEKFGRN